MSKQEKNKWTLPPRYPRGDPRNKLRMKAGAAIGRQMQGQDKPVRKLRKIDSCFTVTVPPWIVEWLGIVKGDSIAFHKTKLRGVVTIVGKKRPGDIAGCRRGG